MKETLTFLLVICCSAVNFGQNKQSEQDSIPKDSIISRPIVHDSISDESRELYEDLKKYSEKSKFTKKLHDLIFREKDSSSGKDNDDKKRSNFGSYTGKIIRSIKVNSTDPFGYSVTDTTKTPRNWAEKTGNAVHSTSRDFAIEKFFLFKENEKLDSVKIYETTRILREQKYVHRVRIVPRAVEEGKDSVDLEVRVLDSWSLIPKIRISGSHMKVGAEERNFMGFGHRLDLHYSRHYSRKTNGFESVYMIPNFKNTFIDFIGKYSVDLDKNYDKYIVINREFYSPLTRWAGGAFLQERSLDRPLPDSEDNHEFKDQNLKFIYNDFWGGYAFHLFDNKTDRGRTRNLIYSMRAMFLNYKEKPSDRYDGVEHFDNEQFYLASLGLSTREYISDRYIFKDGDTEDVPTGSLYSITSGMQRKHHHSRLYLGGRATYGRYFDWGFLSGDFEIGSFFKNGFTAEQSALSLKINYFSNLLDLGSGWKMRQFVKPQFVIGLNRKDLVTDRLSLNDDSYFKGVNSYEYLDYIDRDRYIDYTNGSIRGFESSANGTRKYVLDLQSQFYSPWELLGFHLNPFFDISLGVLTGSDESYHSNRLYSSFSLGFIIRNDYFVFDSFQLSISLFPSMPGEDGSNFRTNSFRNEDYGFQDFAPEEPRPIIYE